MEPVLFRSRFSTHFNRLTYLGMWPSEMVSGPLAKRIYFLVCMVWHSVLFSAIVLQMIDFYLAIGNIRKLTFNICTSGIVVGYTFKMMLLYDRKDHLNGLRASMWRDSLALDGEEDVALQDDAFTQLRFIQLAFYSACMCVLPTLLVSSYFSYKWGPRELPFAAYLPMADPLDDAAYVPALVFEGICSFYVIFMVMEAELSTFSVILQIDAFYRILIKNINKLNRIYADKDDVVDSEEEKKANGENAFRREVNVLLKQDGAEKLLKVSVIRHLKLIEYTEIFEFVYSRCMFLHAFAGSFLIIANGLQLILYINEINVKFCFQTVFMTMVAVDLLFICYYLTRLSVNCGDVGNAAYCTFWYKMQPDMRKKLSIMIMRSRRPPRVTGLKFFVMDLQTFLHIISNIYSWLMLMRQVMPTK